MDDRMLDLIDPGDRLVGRLLQVYGEESLSPSIAATTRMRMAVMGPAHRRAALLGADARFGPTPATEPVPAVMPARSAHTAWRRPVAAVMVGCLTLGILAGSALAASPGGPLYQARIWSEMATLPAGVVERAEAEVHRLGQRLQEAQQASSAGDASATQAALAAYSSIVLEATRGADGDPAASAVIEVAIARHVIVLTQLIGSAPASARSALEQALASSTKAIDDLVGGVGPDGEQPVGGGASGPTDEGGNKAGGQTHAGASASPARPDATPSAPGRQKPDKATGRDDSKQSRERDPQHPSPRPTSDGSHGSPSGPANSQP